MNTNRRLLLTGLGAALLALTAVSTAFLLPPSEPDLMARSMKIVDLAGVDEFEFYWMDGHRLAATVGCCTESPSVVSIDVSAKTITPLVAVNAALKRLKKPYYDPILMGAVPSPDGQWLLCYSFPSTSGLMRLYAIRVRDGLVLHAAQTRWSFHPYWLADSRHWIAVYYVKPVHAVVYSLDDPMKKRTIPLPFVSFSRTGDLGLEKVDAAIGLGRVVVQQLRRYGGKNRRGVVSPNGTRIAWLRQGDSLDWAPYWLKAALSRCGYVSHTSGEIWTTRIDGTGRQEIGQFGNQPPPPPRAEIDYLNWTPDGKRLVFDRGRVLYSVPVPTSAP